MNFLKFTEYNTKKPLQNWTVFKNLIEPRAVYRKKTDLSTALF